MVTALADHAWLRTEAALAARILAVNWPIDTFIAVNPLGGLEDLPFDEAVTLIGDAFGANGLPAERHLRTAYQEGRITDQDLTNALSRRFPELLNRAPISVAGRQVSAVAVALSDLTHGAPADRPDRTVTLSERTAPAVADAVDGHTAKWCAAFLDAGQAAWAMPGRERGFYLAWRDLAGRDRSLPGRVRTRIRALPDTADAAALAALTALGVPRSAVRTYLTTHLTRLPGWAAHVAWRGEHDGGIDVLTYLSMRLSYESAFLFLTSHRSTRGDPGGRAVTGGVPATTAERAARVAAALGAGRASNSELAAVAEILWTIPVTARARLWLEAFENSYRDRLLTSLPTSPAATRKDPPAAQLVCCIDVRSEGLRRHLEATGDYETLGFAGFFAVAIRFQDLAGGGASSSCPVLIMPRNDIREVPAPGEEARAERQLVGRRALAGAQEAFHTAKDDMSAPFALAEGAGWVAGPVAAAKTLLAGPYGTLRRRVLQLVAPTAPSVLTIDQGFTLDEQVLFARVALTMMGLTRGFAKLIVLCGHGSSTENNPYQAALDCGACGGHRGAPNARTAAAILNRPEVRERLTGSGIDIPTGTWFVAAEHDTALDQITLLDPHLVPAGHRAALDSLAADLATAGGNLAVERCANLPGAPRRPTPRSAAAHVRARATDWAQVFPEWGLAGNAAFIVGPRSLTRDLDLHRRVFLHSYDAEIDTDGTALETILTAPLVVAQWINCQYYFSTVDQEMFGAGSKTIHNVVGGIGVLSGHNGDLQLGLPWQSVGNGRQLIHEPMRLFAVVQAPLDRIDRIVAQNTVLQNLFHNEWVTLAARDRPETPWHRHTPAGWTGWTTTEGTR